VADDCRLAVATREVSFLRAVLDRNGLFDYVREGGYRWVQTPERFRRLRAAVFSSGQGNEETITVLGERYDRKSAYMHVGGQFAEEKAPLCPFERCGRILQHIGEPHECSRLMHKASDIERIMLGEVVPTDRLHSALLSLNKERQEQVRIDRSVMRGIRPR
jgi:hypothetical protein